MQKLLRLSNVDVESRIGKSLIETVLDTKFTSRIIDPNLYENTVKNLLEIFYAESGFIIDDQLISDTISLIEAHPIASTIWKAILNTYKINLHLAKKRVVTFKTGSVSIPISYADVPLISDERFTIIEYTVGIKEIKLLRL